jgi:hypothetical protein
MLFLLYYQKNKNGAKNMTKICRKMNKKRDKKDKILTLSNRCDK